MGTDRRCGAALPLLATLVSVALAACTSSTPRDAPGTASVVSAPVRVAHTTAGTVGYRIVGSGPPLVLIMGYAWSMEDWDPRLVHVLAGHHRVVMFDNTGVGQTTQLTPPVSIDDMAQQTSALITTLGLGRVDVLGWSLGGTVAQALAVLHPAQVGRLVLCATFPGNGQDTAPPPSAQPDRSDFPANQARAQASFKAAIAEYPAPSPSASPATAGQAEALSDWNVGQDPAGRKTGRIAARTLIADGTEDALDPLPNDRTLHRLIRGSQLKLYPGAGHAFLFQDWPSFGAEVSRFLA